LTLSLAYPEAAHGTVLLISSPRLLPAGQSGTYSAYAAKRQWVETLGGVAEAIRAAETTGVKQQQAGGVILRTGNSRTYRMKGMRLKIRLPAGVGLEAGAEAGAKVGAEAVAKARARQVAVAVKALARYSRGSRSLISTIKRRYNGGHM
jgi:hypothetical protein